MLGQSVQTVCNRIASKRYFSRLVAEKWSAVFGFDKVFLMTGEGSINATRSFIDYLDDMECLIFVIDHLLVMSQNETVRRMWHLIIDGKIDEFEKLEVSVLANNPGHMRLPRAFLERLRFLHDYSEWVIDFKCP